MVLQTRPALRGFSVTMRDSSKLASFLGNRQIEYMNPILGQEAKPQVNKVNTSVHIEKEAARRDDEWWDNARPYALSTKEQNIYNMVDSIKHVPLYNNIYNVVNTIVSGYLETKYLLSDHIRGFTVSIR